MPQPPTLTAQLLFKPSGSHGWLALDEAAQLALAKREKLEEEDRRLITENKRELTEYLQTSLQLPNLSFFGGSGVSLGEVGGPSMWDLWRKSLFEFPDTPPDDKNYGILTKETQAVVETIRYQELEQANIEHLLSCCDAYLQVWQDEGIADFCNHVKRIVLSECTKFLESEHSGVFMNVVSDVCSGWEIMQESVFMISFDCFREYKF